VLAAVAATTVRVDGAAVTFTVSAGIAPWDPRVGSIDDLQQRADRALHTAKAAGRNRVACWTSEPTDTSA
jgi:PleD family two-component response regulator